MKYIQKILYMISILGLLPCILMNFYIEPTDKALITASVGRILALGIFITTSIVVFLVLRVTQRYYKLAAILPSAMTFLGLSIGGAWLSFPLSVITATIILLIKPKTRAMWMLLACATVISLTPVAWSYYLNNRTGSHNPYTNECIAEGYQGARGDYCY